MFFAHAVDQMLQDLLLPTRQAILFLRVGNIFGEVFRGCGL